MFFLHFEFHFDHDTSHTTRCAPLLAGWQRVLFLDSNGTMAATSQHHHPACERLLVGGDGGAADDGTRTTNDHANERMPTNAKRQGQRTRGITNSGEDERTGEAVGERWGQRTVGQHGRRMTTRQR